MPDMIVYLLVNIRDRFESDVDECKLIQSDTNNIMYFFKIEMIIHIKITRRKDDAESHQSTG